MELFDLIASGATAGSMVGGNIAVLVKRPTVVGAAVGGLVGAGCGLAVGVAQTLRELPDRLARC